MTLGAICGLAAGRDESTGHVQYDSFGNPTEFTAPIADFLFAFTGRPLDPDTGLYDYRARWYDPQVGRFVSEDPIGFAAGDANLYRYAGNSPVVNVDPWGLCYAGFSDFHGYVDSLFAPPAYDPRYDVVLQSHIDTLSDLMSRGYSDAEISAYMGGESIANLEQARGGGSWYHVAMDTLGAIDPFGVVDTIHAFDYALEGNYAAAGIVLAGALVPYFGDTLKGARYVDEGASLLRWSDNATSIARYSDETTSLLTYSYYAPKSGLSRGVQLRAKYGAQFDEYMHFREQGFKPAQAKYLTQPYGSRMGHHYPIPRRTGRDWSIPEAIVDSRFNVLRPRDISIGRFYELHYGVDPHFHGAAFPRAIGGSWRGSQLGLQRYSGLQRVWSATPGSLKVAGGTGIVAGGGGVYWWLSGDNEE